jgi:hypothetical protein
MRTAAQPILDKANADRMRGAMPPLDVAQQFRHYGAWRLPTSVTTVKPAP